MTKTVWVPKVKRLTCLETFAYPSSSSVIFYPLCAIELPGKLLEKVSVGRLCSRIIKLESLARAVFLGDCHVRSDCEVQLIGPLSSLSITQ